MAKYKGSQTACPVHGWLPGPYTLGRCNITKESYVSITCAFCAKCNCYYTTAMAARLSAPANINGMPVRIGIVQVPEEQLPVNDVGIHAPKLHLKGTGASKKDTAGSYHMPQGQKKPIEPKKSTKESTADIKASALAELPVCNSFEVVTNIRSFIDHICPVCNSRTSDRKFNVPVFDENEKFVRYSIEKFQHCYACRQNYILKEDLLNIIRKINIGNTHMKYGMKPSNGKIKQSGYNGEYQFAPIINDAIYLNNATAKRIGVQETNTIHQDINLNKVSFLRELGYSTSVSVMQRRDILNRAVSKYGRRKVVDHLSFLIRTRESQYGGEKTYANAIRIWQSDINYLTDIHKRT